MNLRITALAGACLCLGWAQASAQSPALNKADKQFMTIAAKANMTEAHLGQMAESQAAGSSVKNFAETLVQDHTKAYEDLTALSTKTGENIPRGINVAKDATIQQLSKLKGSGFDRRFLLHEIADHEKALAAFKREAAQGRNPEVKGYAQSYVHTIEEHLQKAQALAKAQRHA